MRILNVICVGSVPFLTILAAIADCGRQKEDPFAGMGREVSELVQFPRDQITVKSASATSDSVLWPITKLRRKRDSVASAAVNVEAVAAAAAGTKRRELKRKKNKREREREAERQRRVRNRGKERNAERYGDKKRSRKREPLTRHARRPQQLSRTRRPEKNAGANRTRSRQHSHDRRNLEKQYLVRNRTLELLERKTTEAAAANRSAFIYPVNNLRDVILERRMTPEKIGQMLGEGRRAPSLRITDLLIPKTFLEAESKKNRVEIKGDDFNAGIESIQKLEPNYNENVEVIRDPYGPAGEAEPPLFLAKFKSIAMNVSRINKAVQNLGGDNPDVETSASTKTDFDESSYRYDYENVFENPSVSPWVNPPRSKEATAGREDQEYFLDRALLSSVYMPIDDQITLQQGLATLLARLFQTLRNTTDYENQELLQDLDFDNSVQGDLCQKWLDCKDKLEEAFLGPLVLPACPCHYPSSIFYDDKIWDEGQQRHFRWRDVSGEAERLDVYKPGATYCIRSLLAQGGGSAAAQHCCYDGRRRLLTRGSGAGTPNFVSPEVSSILHERIDILPWRLCKGDFSRFNKVRPPNNDNHCKENPDEDEYQRQIDTTKHY